MLTGLMEVIRGNIRKIISGAGPGRRLFTERL